MSIGEAWQLWAGLRRTRIDRETVRTDGSRPSAYERSFTTPWLALSREVTPGTLVYASWGQGVESEVVPNRSFYVNRGETLVERSRQIEAGLKVAGEAFDGSLAVFDIRRPMATDFCNAGGDCTRALDGEQRHRGVEGSAAWRAGPWQLQGSAMHLAASRQGASDPALDGLRPTNVPATTLRLHAAYDVPAWTGLTLQAGIVHESSREVLPDNSVEIPAWTRLDLAARWRSALGGLQQVWRLGVDNATDRRAWREAPYQFGHAYLFPLAPRTWRASVTAAF
jgi:iron complex outermembrane receptor protein